MTRQFRYTFLLTLASIGLFFAAPVVRASTPDQLDPGVPTGPVTSLCCCTSHCRTQTTTKTTYDSSTICAELNGGNASAYMYDVSKPGVCPQNVQGQPANSYVASLLATDRCKNVDMGAILPPCTCSGDCPITAFVQLAIHLYAFGLKLLIPLAIFFLIIGGLVLLTAAGYDQRITMGKNIINQTIAGAIIILLSWVIVDTVVVLLIPGQKVTDQRGTTRTVHYIFSQPWDGATFTYTCDDNALSPGCKGPNVKDLQSRLVKLGYVLPTTGIYATKTAAAVENFQSVVNGTLTSTTSASCSVALWQAFLGSFCNGQTSCTVDADTLAAAQLPAGNTVNAQVQGYLTTIANSSDFISNFKTCKKNLGL